MSIPPIVGKMLGAKEWDSIQQVIKIAVKFIVAWQIAIAIILYVAADPLAHLLTADKEVISIVHQYLIWVPMSLGSLGVCMLMVSACNALGVAMRALTISMLRLFVCFLPMLWLGSTLFGLNGIFIGALVGNTFAGIMAWMMYHRAFIKIKESK